MNSDTLREASSGKLLRTFGETAVKYAKMHKNVLWFYLNTIDDIYSVKGIHNERIEIINDCFDITDIEAEIKRRKPDVLFITGCIYINIIRSKPTIKNKRELKKRLSKYKNDMNLIIYSDLD